MIISVQNRYIFIAVPKTGTTSIQQLILEHDPSATKYSVEIEGETYNFGEHDTALQIRRTLGKRYSQFRTFGFIRNPFSRIVSSFFFYRNGNPITRGNKRPWPSRLKKGYAKVTPFKLWALSYPYKSNIEHLVDEHNNVIVDYIGTFESLKNDITKIFRAIDLDIPTDQLKHTNRSDHLSSMEYFSNKIFKKAVEKLIQRDLLFYEKYKYNL
jgi:hypothetical protein